MSYERLPNDAPETSHDEDSSDVPLPNGASMERRFSWAEYAVFTLIGVAMLWSWNMFLAAAPYFQFRFRSNKAILTNFQATQTSVSNITNLVCMFVLAKLQAGASYPRRIFVSLLIYISAYTLLAISTKQFLGISATGYFVFYIIVVFASSIATGFIQNGSFAYASGFGRPEYLQGILLGQAIAGVAPPIVQIITVLSAGEGNNSGSPDQGDPSNSQQSSTSAMAYFITATVISGVTIVAFLWLLQKARKRSYHEEPTIRYEDVVSESRENNATPYGEEEPDISSTKRTSVPLSILGRKLFFYAVAVFVTFVVTMVFPAFTQEILSTSPSKSPLFQPAAFIPLAFLVWNLGDLLGRLIPTVKSLSLGSRPRALLVIAVLRIIFVPLYLLCNIQQPQTSLSSATTLASAAVATVRSDWFYLLVVQLPFGLTNGYLGSCIMMGSSAFVEPHERQATGALMALFLVGGLSVGSLLSFFVTNATG